MTHSIRISFSQLIGDMDLDEFLLNIWERAPHVAPAAVSELVENILTLDDFDILLSNAAVSTASGLSIVDNYRARPIMLEDASPANLNPIYEAYGKGHSLLLSGLQHRWPPVADICRQIESELVDHSVPLMEALRGNAYLTPSGSQGFDIHYDNHCVIIIQLHGTKRWTVFAPQEELPVARCERAIPREELGAPILETDLAVGDVLYVPRGFPHFAVSGESSSLHLTFSLNTMTWLDVVDALCREIPAFRKSVCSVGLGASPEQEYFERELVPSFANIKVDDFLQRRISQGLTGLNSSIGGRLRVIDETAAIRADTPVRRTPITARSACTENGNAVLRFPGGEIQLPAEMKSVFDFIVANKEFRARDLPTIDAKYDAEEFTRILIRRGLVRPTENALQGDDGTLQETS